jgi:hypothetical protein
MAPLVLKEFLIALTGHEFSYQQDYVDENRWACTITCLRGMLLTVSIAFTKFRCHIHWIIWLQSGYNPANNPAYNRNQTRPNQPLGSPILHWSGWVVGGCNMWWICHICQAGYGVGVFMMLCTPEWSGNPGFDRYKHVVYDYATCLLYICFQVLTMSTGKS